MTGKKIHFVGIGGVGMAGVAFLAASEGAEVTGCDLAHSPRTDWLEHHGIRVFLGHDRAHLADSDVIVLTPAVPRDTPECRLALARGARFRGEMLAEIANARETIAVCGSHGKTTTATWIARLLKLLGEDVAWCIGGETGDWPVAGAGKGPLVIEADESDGTLALYRVRTLVVNTCEYDHPDHFPTPADYFACFDTARRQAQDVIESDSLPLDGWDFPVVGTHNRRNARAAVEVALRRGHSREAIRASLPQAVAALPDRRFETIVSSGAFGRVVTDYAHHPTEMACAVTMAREVCRGTLRVLFQPHRYSRTRALLHDFPAAFAGADEVVLCPTYAAFEPPLEGGDVADLYAECRTAGIPVKLARSCSEAWTHARLSAGPDDMTLLLGAGDIIALRPFVEKGEICRHPRRWLGAGTNTWLSDLKGADDCVCATGPAARPGWTRLVEEDLTRRLPWMAGIPGSLGGWVKMNAGAFGHSISEAIDAVLVDGAWLPAVDCGFGYRTSAIAGEIQDVRFRTDLPVDSQPPEAYLARRHRFPPGTKGSVFKNPPGDSAGRLLESVGAKGLRVGGAYVWTEHANVIVSEPDATAGDFLALARLMFGRVKFRLGIELEPEVVGLAEGLA